MEYNKTKRGLEVAAVITALVYCIIELVIDSIGFFQVIAEINNLSQEVNIKYGLLTTQSVISYMITFFTTIAIVVVEIVFICKLLKKPELTESGFKNRKGLRMSFLIFSSLIALYILIGIFIAHSGKIGEFGFLCFATAVILESIAIPMKDVKDDGKLNKKVEGTLDSKIAELKHLKELGVIDEEQYKNAVEKNIKEIL